LLENTPSPAEVLAELRKRLTGTASRFMIEREEIKKTDILLPAIRLKVPKPYHGYTPGAEERYNERHRGKPRNRRIPEHDDWVEFNNLVNDVLDHFEASANVFSKPWGNHLLWIRKGARRRERYDPVETETTWGSAVSVNPGTDDQFGGDIRLKFPDLSEV
jgi:hypothetical protein